MNYLANIQIKRNRKEKHFNSLLLALTLSFSKYSVKAVSPLHGYTFLARDPL